MIFNLSSSEYEHKIKSMMDVESLAKILGTISHYAHLYGNMSLY